jgi:hypothetical protein
MLAAAVGEAGWPKIADGLRQLAAAQFWAATDASLGSYWMQTLSTSGGFS